ncbi:zinc/manganese transport system substrate-binding protein [Dehalogenimonas formicexedens]|uniref:Zinc/manganese transport system substrate-binding protein n=1 Tax=Dehalogenimonas formicexedens TaxID=1839801 RepID=A0A1P8F4X6_9CHLR|nr:metal ABC transporter substrate-binding protein [Dehalogenimonas formicexedens]APV43529.1 zinc/manganese transport system substrate-binding protein [Dehalogenimonas formicexedens]
MKKRILIVILSTLILVTGSIAVLGCGKPVKTGTSIVVTYSVLGSIVKDLVGDAAAVTVSIPNGQDPHDWEPSARDIETINNADLVIENGLGLEAGLEKTLSQARANGVPFFTAADHISVRHVGQGEGIPSGDPDQVIGAPDPHLWMDPLTIRDVVVALAPVLKNTLQIDVSVRATDLESRLTGLNSELAGILDQIPQTDRKLVTGHESMGYFAQRYDFKLVGVIIPSLSSQAEVSAADLAALKQAILDNNVKAIFTEIGTSPVVARAIGDETDVKVVELTTHVLPADGSYFTFMRGVTNTIVTAIK